MLGRVTFAGAVLAACASASDARGEIASNEAHPVPIAIEATAACTDGAAFFARIARKGAAITRGTSADAIAVRVAIDGGNGRYRGSVSLTRRGSAEAERRVEGASCDEVAEALALMIAIALDARAEEAAPPPP